jgi:hypothetical protein
MTTPGGTVTGKFDNSHNSLLQVFTGVRNPIGKNG